MRLKSTARLLPLAFALMSSAALAAPAVTVSPGGDHPQGGTKVSGTGFGANEEVDLYFDTTDEALVTADASGNFGPRTIPVPATAPPGDHWVTAVGRTTITGGQHAFIVRTNWSSFGFTPQGQRHNPYENVIDPTNVGNLDVAWTAPTGGIIYSSPAVAQITGTYNPYIFVGSYDKNLYAFDSAGAIVWKKPLETVVSSAAVSGTTVYAEAGTNLYAFNGKNGAEVWPSPATTGGITDSAPVVANGIVYIGCYDGKVYAFHASDGTPAWPSPAATGAANYDSTPAVANGAVFIGSSDGKLYAFDASTGSPVWIFTTSDEEVRTSPVVSDGVVYFISTSLGGDDDGKLHAVNARTGKQKWAVSYPYDFVNTAPAVANGVVYAMAGELYAYRASDGTKLWTGWYGNGSGSPAVANGVVYIAGGGGVSAYNANGCGVATCLPLWSARNGGGSRPVVANGFVYMGSGDDLYAYALNGGQTPAYTFRNNTHAPSFASLHPDMRLKSSRH